MLSPQAFNQMMANAQYLQSFQQQFQQFTQGMQNGPQQMLDGHSKVQELLANGSMSQSDFQQCRMMANQIMGVNY